MLYSHLSFFTSTNYDCLRALGYCQQQLSASAAPDVSHVVNSPWKFTHVTLQLLQFFSAHEDLKVSVMADHLANKGASRDENNA